MLLTNRKYTVEDVYNYNIFSHYILNLIQPTWII